MRRKKIHRRQRYRALLSDVLPYELPFIFSNYGFFEYLQRFAGTDVKDTRGRGDIRCFQALMEVIEGSTERLKSSYFYSIRKRAKKSKEMEKKERKEEKPDERTLAIPHPFYQREIALLYNQYSDFLLYQTNRSKFSIRFPYKVAFFKGLQKEMYPKGMFVAENFATADDNLKHYFVYKHYQNINGFYDDYLFQRLEKRYSYYIRTDIKHCFDNIRPEMLYDAIYGMRDTIGYETTRAMVSLQKNMSAGDPKKDNNSEANTGVMIGPEFSRIYVEIILQAVDRELETSLKEKGYTYGRDYVFCRYVDDGFFFCNSPEVCNTFEQQYNDILAKWNLETNKDKIIAFEAHPFLESLTIAKRELYIIIDKLFSNREDTLIGVKNRSMNSYRDVPFKISSKYFIRDIQGVIIKYNIQYEDITSTLLSLIRRKLRDDVYRSFYKTFKSYKEAEVHSCIDRDGERILGRYEKSFIDFCREIISILFYIYTCDPRMVTSLKVGQIIIEIIDYVEGKYRVGHEKVPQFPVSKSGTLYKKINDELKQLLTYTSKDARGIELMNLLLIMHRFTSDTRMSSAFIESRLLGEDDMFPDNMNFISIFTLEHIVGELYRESLLQTKIMEWIRSKIEETKGLDSAEAIYTFLIALSCPHFDVSYKKELCQIRDIRTPDMLIKGATTYSNMFVNWRSDNLQWQNALKTSAEVY